MAAEVAAATHRAATHSDDDKGYHKVTNYKFTISYDGTRYQGWERQPSTDMTIQGKLEAVLSRMTDTEVEVIGAGRTDAGVHAKAMIANAMMDT